MTGRRKPVLTVVFERNGEEPVRIEAPTSVKALIRAVAMLLAYQGLQAGDRLTVEVAD
jgi:hypothetical protein